MTEKLSQPEHEDFKNQFTTAPKKKSSISSASSLASDIEKPTERPLERHAHSSSAFLPTNDIEKNIESRVSLTLEKKIEDKLTRQFLGDSSKSIGKQVQTKTPAIDNKKGVMSQLDSGTLSESSIEDMTDRIQRHLEETLEKNIEEKIENNIMTKIQAKIENKIEQEILQKMNLGGMPTLS